MGADYLRFCRYLGFFSETNITKLDGSTVLLACQANGMPLPKIRWTKNGKNVTSNDKIEQKPLGDLQINSLGLEDEGIYVCEGIVMRRKNWIDFCNYDYFFYSL